MGLNFSELNGNQNPFEAGNIGASRLVWHPSVHHDLYYERCSYFLLRLAKPARTFVGDVEKLLRDANITSFCVYPLYGHYDLLVRLWATDQKRRRLLNLLKEEFVPDMTEFVAQEIRYIWADHAPTTARDARKFKESVDKVCHTIEQKTRPNDCDLESLHEQGLLLQMPKDQSRQFKMFVALTPTPGPPRNNRSEMEAIVDFFTKRQGISAVSLYTGFGFTDYFVKFTASDLDVAYECNQDVLERFGALNLRPTTYLVSSRNVQESDHVDAGWREFSGRVLDMDKALNLKYAPDIAKMPPDERETVAALFSKYENLRTTNFGDVLNDLFGARIRGDQTQLAKAMTVLLEFEGYLTGFMRSLWQQVNGSNGGSNWFQITKQAATHIGLGEESVRRPTLEAAVSITNKLVSDNALPSGIVDTVLGESWFEKIKKLSTYRNDLAHGRVFVEADYLSKYWDSVTTHLCDVAPMYNKLSEQYRKK